LLVMGALKMKEQKMQDTAAHAAAAVRVDPMKKRRQFKNPEHYYHTF